MTASTTGMRENAVNPRMAVYFNKLTVRVITLLPLTTLFQSKPGFGAVNQMVIALSMLSFALAAMVTNYQVAYWLFLLLTTLLTAINVLMTQGSFVNVNLVIYLLFWVLLLSLFAGKMQLMRRIVCKDYKWMRNIAVIWCVIVTASIPLQGSYYNVRGQGRFFRSFAEDSFRLSPAALLVLTLLIICVRLDFKHRNLYALLSLCPLFCAFMGYSRTYLGVILLAYALFLWEYSSSRRMFYALSVFGCIAAGIVISVSSISSKISATSQDGYLGFWDTLTSGRSSFWAHDMRSYADFDLLHMLLGGGFNKIYEINQQIDINIWAHNDFINILVTNGLVGLALYMLPLVLLMRNSYRARVNAPWFLYCILFLQWLVNAFFNMEYTYVCASIATVLAYLLLTFPSEKER